jgi:hypothetical protein
MNSINCQAATVRISSTLLLQELRSSNCVTCIANNLTRVCVHQPNDESKHKYVLANKEERTIALIRTLVVYSLYSTATSLFYAHTIHTLR